MNAEQNFRLLREIDDHREFVLAVYRQNPQLLEHAERRIRQLFEPLPDGDSGDEEGTAGLRLDLVRTLRHTWFSAAEYWNLTRNKPMIAIEIEAPIVNHRIDFSSERLPLNIAQAKIIVMYEEAPTVPATSTDILALARAARASFPKDDSNQLRDEFAVARSEWETRGHAK